MSSTNIIIVLLAVAATGAAIALLRVRQVLQKTARELGLPELRSSTVKLAHRTAAEISRLRRAFAPFTTERAVERREVSFYLRQIAETAQVEYQARGVEIALFDQANGLWSQGISIGYPRGTALPPSLAAEVERGKQVQIRSGETVLHVVPLVFAGIVFGALRVEVDAKGELPVSDLAFLNLLATQGAMLLVDARFTDELLRMRQSSEESVRARTGFLANLSHEIRGPLGTVLNGSELILDGLCGPLTDMQRETLQMVKNSGDHLLDLVNDVLDYARVEAGKVVAKPVANDVPTLLEDLAALIRSHASGKKQTITLKPVPEGLAAQCDKRHIRQMLINMLTNAVKYTPDGGTVTLGAMRVTGNRLKFFVEDTGIGIPEDQKDKVFAPFERVDDAYAAAQGGTGLGMPLTRKLAEVNGGTLGFDSTVGQGSTFWLILPAAEGLADEAHSGEASEEMRLPQGKGELVLIVDNDEQSREMLRRYLEEQGFKIAIAASGADVHRLLKEQSVDLALVENDMPDLPGEEMVALIRGTPSATAVPLVLLSAKAFVFDIERFLKLGVDRCLSKPVSLKEVAVTIRRLLDQSSGSN